jgi:hypothetical protein
MWSLREETNLSRLLSFDYFCIADGDPIIKRALSAPKSNSNTVGLNLQMYIND